tara:strand:- start:1849 stop:3618 length:1770 start_codon:yes stop_codon:yes gene_type:complete
MVVSDGFFTSHQRTSVELFKNKQDVQKFLGPRKDAVTSLNPRQPITIGPYMNDPDLINNKYQLHIAHEAAKKVYSEITIEYEKLTGRSYPALDCYQIDDAQTALFLLNSSGETAKDAIDKERKNGKKVGCIRPNLLRPFPFEEIRKASHSLSSLVIGERADTPGSQGGPLSHEVQSVLLADHHCSIKSLIRVYGLGGKDFREEDAQEMLNEGIKAISGDPNVPLFDFIGVDLGKPKTLPPQILSPLTKEEMSTGLTKIEMINSHNEKRLIKAQSAPPSELAGKPKRIAPGHGACPGCGIFSGLDQFFKGIEGDVVVLYHTGCAMVVTTDYPFSAHRVTYLHNLFQNGAPTLSGLVEVFHEKKRRGEIPDHEDITFVMVTGDGGMDIGMGPTIGTALRNHKMIILEYDNQGYMNTGGQMSYTTPLGKQTATTHVGLHSFGKAFHHKDTASIMAATGIPYVFTAIEGFGTDLVEKAAKAKWFAENEGLAFGKILISCPLNWGVEERHGFEILNRAVDSCFFPVYEIQKGLTTLNYNPEEKNRKVPVAKWLELMASGRHLLKPEFEQTLSLFQKEVDRRWERIKAQAQHPLL